jgi:hypothetical protein
VAFLARGHRKQYIFTVIDASLLKPSPIWYKTQMSGEFALLTRTADRRGVERIQTGFHDIYMCWPLFFTVPPPTLSLWTARITRDAPRLPAFLCTFALCRNLATIWLSSSRCGSHTKYISLSHPTVQLPSFIYHCANNMGRSGTQIHRQDNSYKRP